LLACNNAAKDSALRRTRINALLVGDPGLGKSIILYGATEIVPKSRFVSGTTTSVKTAVGIVVRDQTGEFTRPGPIVKAAGAICAYDEIGALSYEEQKYLLNAVQEGRIGLGKWGLTKDLNGSATFIFSANPTGSSGRWLGFNRNKHEQIPVLGALLDRIDLVFIMHTNRDEKHLQDYLDKKLRLQERYKELRAKEQAKHLQISKQLLYCKRFEPKLTDEVIIMLKKFYASILKESE
jgi:DNA replicative helicase MCM subunit Mcm2 (Cdc46/Mcm family)